MTAVVTVSDDPKELFGQGLLASFWNNENLNDFALKGTDGVEVAANRYILAAKSKFFQNMLLGKFKEASSPVVEVGFPGSTIQQVVEYVYTDKVKGLMPLKHKASSDDNPLVDRDQIQCWIHLLEASIYFDLPRLKEKAKEIMDEIMRDSPINVAFLALEVAKGGGTSLSPDLANVVMTHIKNIENPKIEASDVGILSPSVLENILKEEDMAMTALELFQMLQLWVDAEDPLTSSHQPTIKGDRQSLAKKMVDLIDLSKISPEHLSKFVRPSGFVSSEKLLDVFCKAVRVEEIPGEFRVPLNCPASIKVVGAGDATVNGVYCYIGQHYNYPKFCMKTIEKDCWVYKVMTGSWFLSTVPPGKECNLACHSRDVIDLYKNEEDRLPFPPEGNWTRCDGGGGGPLPPPKIGVFR